MAPRDRNPNRGASPMQAGETPTTADDGFEPTTVSPMPERTRAKSGSDGARGKDPRSTEVFRERRERPDVLGAPERTVVAPMPPRHVEVDPIPDASSNATRLAAEADARRRRRAEEDARAREENVRRDQQRRQARDERARQDARDRERGSDRERRDPRETDRELAADAPRPAAKEKTAPSAASLAARDDGRRKMPREPAAGDQSLVRQNTAVASIKADTPYTRLGVAIRDVSNAIVLSSKTVWTTLRTEGVKPYIVRMQPGAQRVWRKTRGYLLRLRAAAVTKAVELGLVKPKRVNEYEQHGDDRLDQGRVDAWRKFHKGKTSSSYLQDDE